jgi:endonuclease/exonuclease/phosphatase family metal-dependent hydrolase
MIILDVRIRDHVVRIVACHWQSKMGEDNADETRNRLAHALSIQNYNFVNEDIEKHHLVIIGDFNAEPYERSLKTLHAHRDRARSKGVAHWTDGDVKRLHLYNTSWRLLGEQYPHPRHRARHSAMGDCAGTYYWEGGKAWRHFDQLIVSGGLLGDQLPHIDENETVIVSSEAFVADGLPVKFSRDGKRYIGLSDHLPIYANVHI